MCLLSLPFQARCENDDSTFLDGCLILLLCHNQLNKLRTLQLNMNHLISGSRS